MKKQMARERYQSYVYVERVHGLWDEFIPLFNV